MHDEETEWDRMKRAFQMTENFDYPSVSVIVPCRDEEACIARCLESLLDGDYPTARVEIVVVDGLSRDRTRSIVNHYVARHPRIRIVDNEEGSIPAAMNIGIAQSTGLIVMKADAHSSYPPTYISDCVKHLLLYGAEMVGGVISIVPRCENPIAKSIALSLCQWFGSGNAYVKTGCSTLRWADAAAFGCWKRDLFHRVGFFDERLFGSSDMEHNIRIKATGGRILLVPEIKITYYADADVPSFWQHNFSDGFWVTYVWKYRKQAASWRHFAPLALVLAILLFVVGLMAQSAWMWTAAAICAFYIAVNLAVSLELSIRHKNPAYMAILPLVFGIRHVAHGLGALYGLLRLPGRPLEHRNVPRAIAR
jgi:glycosyltransferase involved in cell wall biosynthesis